jgi:hypothetical protein
MTSAQEALPKDGSDWRRRVFERIMTVLAIIGLIDVAKQLVEWAELIHSVADKYRFVKEWLFAWLPFHIPPEWHDYIILLSILFTVTSVGFHQRTGRAYALFALQLVVSEVGDILLSCIRWTGLWTPNHKPLLIETAVVQEVGIPERVYSLLWIPTIALLLLVLGSIAPKPAFGWGISIVIGFAYGFFGMMLTYILVLGAVIAWRWVATTAAVFTGLVVVNEIYMHWLK